MPLSWVGATGGVQAEALQASVGGCWASPGAPEPAGGGERGRRLVLQHSCGRWALLPTGPAPEPLSGMLQRQAEPRSFPHSALFPLTPRHPQVSVEAASSWISPSWKREPEETCPQEYKRQKKLLAFPSPHSRLGGQRQPEDRVDYGKLSTSLDKGFPLGKTDSPDGPRGTERFRDP